jgi:hypothetical protein
MEKTTVATGSTDWSWMKNMGVMYNAAEADYAALVSPEYNDLDSYLKSISLEVHESMQSDELHNRAELMITLEEELWCWVRRTLGRASSSIDCQEYEGK